MSGVRTRRRHCYGGNEGDYGCEGTSREIKVCQQDSCEAMVKECSQSKWNFKAGSEATFKVEQSWTINAALASQYCF